jgi:hypothetical protein
MIRIAEADPMAETFGHEYNASGRLHIHTMRRAPPHNEASANSPEQTSDYDGEGSVRKELV